jgi:hypothetical protein
VAVVVETTTAEVVGAGVFPMSLLTLLHQEPTQLLLVEAELGVVVAHLRKEAQLEATLASIVSTLATAVEAVEHIMSTLV